MFSSVARIRRFHFRSRADELAIVEGEVAILREYLAHTGFDAEKESGLLLLPW